jgi:hypothetical protein
MPGEVFSFQLLLFNEEFYPDLSLFGIYAANGQTATVPATNTQPNRQPGFPWDELGQFHVEK